MQLKNIKTDPKISKAAVQGLKAWRQEDCVPVLPPGTPQIIKKAWEEQAAIGWDQFILGQFSKKMGGHTRRMARNKKLDLHSVNSQMGCSSNRGDAQNLLEHVGTP